jgi:hypothetical protein
VLEAARSVITDIITMQPDRSMFPHNFFPPPADESETLIRTDALLPRKSPNAILKVEGPFAGFHNSPNQPKSTQPTPPATPAIPRRKRHTGRPMSQNSPQHSSESKEIKKSKRGNDKRPTAASPYGTKTDPGLVPLTLQDISAEDQKGTRSDSKNPSMPPPRGKKKAVVSI